MTASQDWRAQGVRIVRATSIDDLRGGAARAGRASIFDFSGSGGQRTWIGSVTLEPGANTGPHHHGRHEVAIYVVRGRAEIRWGNRLEFLAEIGQGDFAYFPPHVPHQEHNRKTHDMVEFVVVRSDNERIIVPLPLDVASHPERVT